MAGRPRRHARIVDPLGLVREEYTGASVRPFRKRVSYPKIVADILDHPWRGGPIEPGAGTAAGAAWAFRFQRASAKPI